MKMKCKRLVSALLLICLNVGMLTMVASAASSSKLATPEVTLTNVESTGKIKISWKPVKKAVSYKVYRSTDGKKWSRLITTKKTSVVNTSATAGKSYYYKVRAIASKSSRNSAYSEVQYGTCDLARPSITLSSVSSTGKIKVSWKSVKKAVSYEVYRSLDGTEWSHLYTTKNTSMTNTSAEPETKYYYKVRAIASNSEANSAFSTAKYRTCDLARPVITLSTVESTGKTMVSWEGVEGADSYKVYTSRNKSSWTCIKTTTDTSVTHTSGVAGRKYYYKVRAISSNSSANSAYSSIKYRICQKPQPVEVDPSVYQQEAVELARDIALNWNTVYAHGQSNGVKNSDGTYGFDCSGFATYVLNTVMQKRVPTYRLTSSISKLPTLTSVYNAGYPGEFNAKTVKYSEMQPGDIVFFSQKSTNDHCGMYLGDGKFAHSSSYYGGVVIMDLKGSYIEDLSVIRRYLPETITPANTDEVIASSCGIYKERANDDTRMFTLKKGTTVTVIYNGNNGSYNQAYVETSDGTRGFVYTKNFK